MWVYLPASAAPCAGVDAFVSHTACAQGVPNKYTHAYLDKRIHMAVY